MRARLALLGVLTTSLCCSPALPPNARGAPVSVSVRADRPGLAFEVFDHHVRGRGGHDVYRSLCEAPCDLIVHDWSKFRVEGNAPPSLPFYLPSGAPVVLRAHAGSYALETLGIGGLLLGAVGAWGAGLDALANEGTRPAEVAVVAGSGLVTLALGVLFLALSSTRVAVERGAAE